MQDIKKWELCIIDSQICQMQLNGGKKQQKEGMKPLLIG